MTKRRAEGVLYHDSPHKRLCFQSLCNNDTALPALRVVQDADAPSLLSFLSSHCRKRNYLDDEETPEWSRSRKKSFKSKTNCTSSTDYDNSGRFREACVQSQEVAHKKRPREETQQRGTGHIRNVTEKDEDLTSSTFNSFQFWRAPLPEIDMSLLQSSDESAEPSSGHCTRDTESMET